MEKCTEKHRVSVSASLPRVHTSQYVDLTDQKSSYKCPQVRSSCLRPWLAHDSLCFLRRLSAPTAANAYLAQAQIKLLNAHLGCLEQVGVLRQERPSCESASALATVLDVMLRFGIDAALSRLQQSYGPTRF